jgi:hypothetical protein
MSAIVDGATALTNVVVEDDGGTIEWPDLDVSFSVAEMLPEYIVSNRRCSLGRCKQGRGAGEGAVVPRERQIRRPSAEGGVNRLRPSTARRDPRPPQ